MFPWPFNRPIRRLMIEREFLRARLVQDWDEFRRRGRAVVAENIPKNDRKHFWRAFQKLTTARCDPDVLCLCMYIFLNSRGPRSFPWTQELKFPWKEDWEQVPAGLKRVREIIKALMNESGMATLTSGNWDLDLDEFSSFNILHRDLLGTMDQYIGEFENLCRRLPRKDIIRQYGQAVFCIYVRAVTKLSFAQTSSLLLDCIYNSMPPGVEMTRNWSRDFKRFQKSYPDFCKSAHLFLLEKHRSAVKLPPPDWQRFVRTGNLD